MSDRIRVLAPREKPSGRNEWAFTGWPHGAGLGVWLRRRRSRTEISTSEVQVRATAPRGIAPAGDIRVYQYARIWRNHGRERAAVIVRIGSWRLRLDVASAEALATALRLVAGRPCRCGEPADKPTRE